MAPMGDKATASPGSKRVLGIFTLAMLSVSAILNLRNLPFMASLGLASVFYYMLACVLFLIPSAFICAELATRIPVNGGAYAWVKAAWGKKAGLIAIWMEWINNVIAFPASLATIIATFAYVGIASFSHSPMVMFIAMMTIFWGGTLFNLLNIRITTKLNIIGALLGMIIPGILIITLGVIWVFSGQPIYVDVSIPALLPELHPRSLSLFVGALSGYAGMQILAFHASNVTNPQRTFPRAILLGSLLIFTLSVLATLCLTVVVPESKLNVMNGVIESFALFFRAFHLSWVVPLLALCIVIGALSGLSAWMLGPARAISVAAEDQLLPAVFARRNRNDMPVAVLLIQGVIGTILACLYLFMPTMESAFWLLIALTSQFTVLMFIMIFASAIRLRYTDRQREGLYTIPGGNIIIWVLGLCGILACSVGFILGLFPADISEVATSIPVYVSGMLIGDAIIIAIPILWIVMK